MPPKHKAWLRIPKEQYAYIEVSVQGTADEIVQIHNEFMDLIKPQEGLSTKEWNETLDRYLTDGTGNTEIYFKMSPKQQACIQEIKKSFKRLKVKE